MARLLLCKTSVKRTSPPALARSAALAPLTPAAPEQFATGFGTHDQNDEKPKLFYVVRKSGIEYGRTPNDPIAEDDVPATIASCKSIR